MTILLLSILVITSIVALAVTVRHDGYGHRPAPRSHIESFGPNSHV